MPKLTVQGPPVSKLRARTVIKGGRVITYPPEPSASYQEMVRTLAWNEGAEMAPKGVPVRLRVTFIMGRREVTGRPDVINLVSLIADALNRVWYWDDSQIVDLQCRKSAGHTHPRTVIEVERLDYD